MNNQVKWTSKRFKAARQSLKKLIKQNNYHGKNGKYNGKETRKKRKQVLFKLIYDLHRLGYEIENVRTIKQKHFIAILDMWLISTLSSSTMSNSISQYKRLCEWIGKPHLINEVLNGYERKDELALMLKREGKNDRKIKSFTANSVSVLDAIKRVCRIDYIVAMQMGLMFMFGLRREEAAKFRPKNDINDDLSINAIKGTKGGRPRYNITSTHPNEDVSLFLNHLKSLVKDRLNTSTIPKHYTADQWESYVSRVMQKAGITKDQLGVTLHGLRHEYLQCKYLVLSGKLPRLLVDNGLSHISLDQEKAIRGIVSELAGHERPEITEHYGIC